MNLKQKVKTYSFWISLVSAILIAIRLVGQHFGWFVNENLIMDIVTSVCGILVLLGILSAPTNSQADQTEATDLKEQSKQIQDEQKQINLKIKEDIMAEQLTIQEQIEMLKKQTEKSSIGEQNNNGATEQDFQTQNMQKYSADETLEQITLGAEADDLLLEDDLHKQSAAQMNMCSQTLDINPPNEQITAYAEPFRDGDISDKQTDTTAYAEPVGDGDISDKSTDTTALDASVEGCPAVKVAAEEGDNNTIVQMDAETQMQQGAETETKTEINQYQDSDIQQLKELLIELLQRI